MAIYQSRLIDESGAKTATQRSHLIHQPEASFEKFERDVRECVIKCVKESRDSVVRETSFGGGKNKGSFNFTVPGEGTFTVGWVGKEGAAPGLIRYYIKSKNRTLATYDSQASKADVKKIYIRFIEYAGEFLGFIRMG